MASFKLMGKWELKLQTKRYYDNIKEELHIEPEFADLINYRIIATSKEKVKEEFQNLVYGWSLLGKSVDNSKQVYDEFFNSEMHQTTSKSLKEFNSEIDSIISNATEHSPYIQEEMYNDDKYSQIDDIEESKEKNSIEEDGFKWFNPFSTKGIIYIGIAGVIIYFLYNNISITYTGFIVLGTIALFAFMYFEDNYKKKK